MQRNAIALFYLGRPGTPPRGIDIFDYSVYIASNMNLNGQRTDKPRIEREFPQLGEDGVKVFADEVRKRQQGAKNAIESLNAGVEGLAEVVERFVTDGELDQTAAGKLESLMPDRVLEDAVATAFAENNTERLAVLGDGVAAFYQRCIQHLELLGGVDDQIDLVTGE